MKPLYPVLLLAAGIAISPYTAFAQPRTLEFTSGAGNPTTAQGPVISQVITFQNNTDNPTGNTFAAFTTPTTTATISLSNFQYVLPAAQTSTTTPLMIGATNNTGGPLVAPVNIYNLMSTVGGAADANFTSASTVTAGNGITQATNEAVYLYTSAMGMYNAGASTTGRYYIGDLTITFNSYVTNPVIHLMGLGALDGSLGIATELELQTPSLTLSVLSGSTELTVSSGTKILNGAAHPTATTGAGAASGSILVTGTNIPVLTFKVFLRADGGGTWTAGPHVGDAWMIGISTPTALVTVLPLTITGFTATTQGVNAQLQWQTATEQNIRFFEVQSSRDGNEWLSIGMVTASGNSNTPNTYHFTDVNTAAGNNNYRIKEVDANGNAAYSSVRSIYFEANSQTKVFPNPVKDRLYITGHGSVISSVIISDRTGKQLYQYRNPPSGNSLDMSHLPSGMYLVTIRYASGQTESEKIFKY